MLMLCVVLLFVLPPPPPAELDITSCAHGVAAAGDDHFTRMHLREHVAR